MPKDVWSHIAALENHTDVAAQALAGRLRAHISSGSLQLQSHMFWTAPRQVPELRDLDL
jgi:hypothetical protein